MLTNKIENVLKLEKTLHRMYDKSVIRGRVPFKVVILPHKFGPETHHSVEVYLDCDGNKIWGKNMCEDYRKFMLEEVDTVGRETLQSITKLVFPEDNAFVKVKFEKYESPVSTKSR